MKRLLTLTLVGLLALSAALTGCGGTEEETTVAETTVAETTVAETTVAETTVAESETTEAEAETDAPEAEAVTVKFGTGVYIGSPAATDATADADGAGSLDVTVAAVTVDAEGKIAACQLDTMSAEVKFTADGKAIASEGFKTKYELGDAYSMKAYGGAAKEWFEQADAFEAVCVGKTFDEVKALVAEGGKGTDALITAGCTIGVTDFVGAVEEAYNAAAKEVSADAVLKVNIAVEQTTEDAADDADGSNELVFDIFTAALDADGKVLAATSDCVDVAFTFDANGVSTLDTTKAVSSKRELGDAYGMKAYGGADKEWFEQADAFDAACVGKTTAEIAGLQAEDGKGAADLQTAGCTITVTGFVKAATK